MVDSVNRFISDSTRHFTVISPPITSGLASKVAAIDYGISSSPPLIPSWTSNSTVNRAPDSNPKMGGPLTFVLETTLTLPLELRVRQHLLMVASAMRAFHLLNRDFDFDLDQPPESCVAGRRNCQFPFYTFALSSAALKAKEIS